MSAHAAAPQVIVVAGPNGAGKSTTAPALLKDSLEVVEFVNADTIAAGLSAFRPDSVAFSAGRIMLVRLNELATRKQSFAFETTLASRSLLRWLTRLQRGGYEVHLLFLWLRSAELAVNRVMERVRQGGHHVPADVVRRRYRAGLVNLFELYIPLADRWQVFNNSGRGEPTAIANGRSSTIDNVNDTDAWRALKEFSSA